MCPVIVREGRVYSLRECVRCVLQSVPAQVALWIEGNWLTRVQTASAALAVQGLPYPSGTPQSPRLPSGQLLSPPEPSPDIPSGSEGERA